MHADIFERRGEVEALGADLIGKEDVVFGFDRGLVVVKGDLFADHHGGHVGLVDVLRVDRADELAAAQDGAAVGEPLDLPELVGDEDYTYTIRYIKKLKPIILTDLGDLTIDDETGPMNCQLNDVLHRDILRVAVALAL